MASASEGLIIEETDESTENDSKVDNQIKETLQKTKETKSSTVVLRRLNIKKLPDQIWHDYQHITDLNLSWNSLAEFPSDLVALTNLVHLNAQGNCLESLWAYPSDEQTENQPIFPKLEMLNVAENLLTHLPANLLIDSPSLKALILNGNRLTSL